VSDQHSCSTCRQFPACWTLSCQPMQTSAQSTRASVIEFTNPTIEERETIGWVSRATTESSDSVVQLILQECLAVGIGSIRCWDVADCGSWAAMQIDNQVPIGESANGSQIMVGNYGPYQSYRMESVWRNCRNWSRRTYSCYLLGCVKPISRESVHTCGRYGFCHQAFGKLQTILVLCLVMNEALPTNVSCYNSQFHV
jgi:hypothetical protein